LGALTELADVQQQPRGPRRRWFRSANEDLIVWYAHNGSIVGFQFCYDRRGTERALTWKKDQGYSHDRVDDGEAVGLAHKRTPILVADGEFNADTVLQVFMEAAHTMPRDIVDFVSAKLKNYPTNGKAT
jgi:hypothetical protein